MGSILSMSFLYRYFGFLNCNRHDGLRFTWLQIVPKLAIGFSIVHRTRDDDKWHRLIIIEPFFCSIYLNAGLSPKQDWKNEDYSGWKWAGFSWKWPERNLQFSLSFDPPRQFYDFPWVWKHVITEYRTHTPSRRNKSEWIPDWNKSVLGLLQYTHWTDKPEVQKWQNLYHYCLKNGTIQKVTATICEQRVEWRWRMFHRWRIGPKKVFHGIEVEFSGEVGESSGSWKGGTIGCSYDMKKGESPLDCLRRMERERKFR